MQSSLSAAEIPVVAVVESIETVNAVSWLETLLLTIGIKSSSSARVFVIGVQISPLASFAMKLTNSGVLKVAA